MKIRALKAFTIRDAETGVLTSIAHNGIAEIDNTLGAQLITDGLAEEYTLISPTGSVNITANGVVDVTTYANANVLVEPTVELKVNPVAADVDLLGKLAGELQDNVVVNDGAISGTLKYVTEYTGFSGDESMQSGNYLAIKAEAFGGATITVELINGTVGHPVTLDADGMIVLRITNIATQSVEVIATKGNVSEKATYTLTGLTLEDND